MGVGTTGLHLALMAKRHGADFATTLTIGRQNHFLDAWWVKNIFDRHGIPITDETAAKAVETPYAEDLFKAVGAKTVDSLDASDYEQATVIHDMNTPIQANYHQRYSTVMDYGSLEHIFNVPVAIKNCTDLIKTGGHYIYLGPCNNMMGHGFYQFSPEFFYNYLSVNGFTDIEVFISLYRDAEIIFRAIDPNDFGGRVELVNEEAAQIQVIARKISHQAKQVYPVQSDYQNHLWKKKDYNRSSSVSDDVDPKFAAAIGEYRRRIAALSAWPSTVASKFTPGFENGLLYQAIDPSKD